MRDPFLINQLQAASEFSRLYTIAIVLTEEMIECLPPTARGFWEEADIRGYLKDLAVSAKLS